MDQPTIRRKKTFHIRLTRYELLHLRDLLGITLSTEAQQTVSQALAAIEDRSLVEAKLWQKVGLACEEADLPTGDDAPDFVVAVSAPSPVSVFRIVEDPADDNVVISKKSAFSGEDK